MKAGLFPFFLHGEFWQYLTVSDMNKDYYLTVLQPMKMHSLAISTEPPNKDHLRPPAKFSRYIKVRLDGVEEVQFHCFDNEVHCDDRGRLYRKVVQK